VAKAIGIKKPGDSKGASLAGGIPEETASPFTLARRK